MRVSVRQGRVLALAVASLAASAWVARATGTERFVLDDAASLAAGELDGTTVHSDGRVTVGAPLRRVALPDEVQVVYALVRSGGQTYLGTAHDGRVYRLRGDTAEVFAETGQAVVSSLALGAGGTVYAGTLPEGRIYALAPGREPQEVAQPEGAQHVWALAFDRRRNRLYAATGPDGKVLAIDPRSGDVTTLWEAPDGPVMSLALDRDGTLYAGTAGEAVVVRVSGERVEVAGDFPGNEITALAVRDGVLAVAANELPDPPAIPRLPAKAATSTTTRVPRPRPGKGRLYLVDATGRAEALYRQDDGHFASVALLADGSVIGGAGHDGRVIRVNPDRTTATWIDVDERQVLALDLEGNDPIFATGDGAAVYHIARGRAAEPVWESKVLDARFRARWGELRVRGEGRLVLQTRSGDRETPDETWSEWSADLAGGGPIRSPAARYLQVHARFAADRDAVLRGLTAYFLPQNQRPRVSGVAVHAGTKAAQKRASAVRQGHIPDPESNYKLVWRVDNPDDDRLRYRLRYRLESQSVWRDVLPPREVLTKREYRWDTSAIPDGLYVVEVEASDELDNPADLALQGRAASEPLRIDNHAPQVLDLRASGARLTGRAVDGLGPIARLEWAADGGDWAVLFPVDDLFDTREERFEVDLSGLATGPHLVAVRATDASGNAASAEVEVRR